jgi:hypothetical protein
MPETRRLSKQEAAEQKRLIGVLEKRFPGFSGAVWFAEVATPVTIERYTNKNGGAVAGPKQMLGQHMFNRLHPRTEWDHLFCCGESPVMGTGPPPVTTSGISAANAVLKKLGKQPFMHDPSMKNVVMVLNKPFTDIAASTTHTLRLTARHARRHALPVLRAARLPRGPPQRYPWYHAAPGRRQSGGCAEARGKMPRMLYAGGTPRQRSTLCSRQ